MATNKPAPRKRGRPKIEFDLKKVEMCGLFGATYETMRWIFDCSYDTIRRNMQDETSDFCKAYKRGDANLNMKLSEAQINTALKGNPSMLIWLGKQRLGQKDTPEYTENSPVTVTFKPHRLAEGSGH